MLMTNIQLNDKRVEDINNLCGNIPLSQANGVYISKLKELVLHMIKSTYKPVTDKQVDVTGVSTIPFN
jgi:hypothetical protein